MATKGETGAKEVGTISKAAIIAEPHSLRIAEQGVTNSRNFAALMSAVIADVITGRLPTEVANSTVAAGRTLLRVVEMEHKYGKAQPPTAVSERPVLDLAPGRAEDN